MENFVKFIRQTISIDESELNIVLSRSRKKSVRKGTLILKKGQIANQYFFIVAGGLRFFKGNFFFKSTIVRFNTI